ncbi:MAG: ABC transporter substrate binding protein [Pseudomonadota bacterium]
MTALTIVAPQAAFSANILVVHSFHTGFDSTQIYLDTIDDALSGEHQIHDVFLDTKRIDPERAFQLSEEALADRVNVTKPDLVLAIDDNALILVSRNRETVFRDIPVLFAGVNGRYLSLNASQKSDVAGVFEYLSLDKTIALARNLQNEPLRKFVAITDESRASQAALTQLRLSAANVSDFEIEEIRLSDYLLEDLAAKLSRYPDRDAAFILLDAHRDKTGLFHEEADVVTAIAPSSTRPLFGISGQSIIAGAVAGHIVSHNNQANTLVSMAQRVLDGEQPGNVVPADFLKGTAFLNQPQAERYGLAVETASDDLVVVGMDPGFFERYSQYFVIALIAGLASGLCVFIVRRADQRLMKSLDSVNEELRQHSMVDALTGLPNRLYVIEHLNDERGMNVTRALFHIDLDRFKQVNDSYGHEVGDYVLRTVASRLKSVIPRNGFAARTSGDEFLVMADFRIKDEIKVIGQRIVDELSKSVRYEEHNCRFGASVGIAVVQDRGKEEFTLFQRADIALNRAKGAGRGQYKLYTPELGAQFSEEKALADEIAWGLDNHEFVPYFQPQICAETGKVKGVEALARWMHSKRGILAPESFLNVAERMGLVAEIDREILLCCQDVLADWRGRGIELEKLSVNTSGDRLSSDTLFSSIEPLDLGKTQLCFELLESIFMDDEEDPLIDRLNHLREQNIRIEIDDFGSGHASIISLNRLKPDGFKISRHLVAAIEEDESMAQMVRSLMDMGRKLNMDVIADGVETEEQMWLLKEMGCKTLQGYGYCHPVSADLAAEFILKRNRRHQAA